MTRPWKRFAEWLHHLFSPDPVPLLPADWWCCLVCGELHAYDPQHGPHDEISAMFCGIVRPTTAACRRRMPPRTSA